MEKKQVAKKEQKQALAIEQATTTNILPETGLVRVAQIVGDRKKGIVPIVPVSRSGWFAGIKKGIYPAGFLLSPRVRVWNAEQIRNLIGKEE